MEIQNSKYAIDWGIGYNLSFGNDIVIHDSSDTTHDSYSFIGSNYNYNHYVEAEYDPNEFFFWIE